MSYKPNFTTGSRRQNIKNRIDWSYSNRRKRLWNNSVILLLRLLIEMRWLDGTRKDTEVFEETETNQFVYEEWRTNKDEMSSTEWFNLKTHYTYFRY